MERIYWKDLNRTSRFRLKLFDLVQNFNSSITCGVDSPCFTASLSPTARSTPSPADKWPQWRELGSPSPPPPAPPPAPPPPALFLLLPPPFSSFLLLASTSSRVVSLLMSPLLNLPAAVILLWCDAQCDYLGNLNALAISSCGWMPGAAQNCLNASSSPPPPFFFSPHCL